MSAGLAPAGTAASFAALGWVERRGWAKPGLAAIPITIPATSRLCATRDGFRFETGLRPFLRSNPSYELRHDCKYDLPHPAS